MVATGAPVSLRPYQGEAVSAVREKWMEGDKATLLVMATGTGKTTVFGEIARRSIENGRRVLVLAHRGELIEQAARRLEHMCGVPAEIEKAESYYTYRSPLCIASVQTLQGARLENVPRGFFDCTIIDEAHHSISKSYRDIIEHVGGYLLGVTATADRADKKGLAAVYDSIAYEYPLARAVADGYLAPIRAKCLPLSIDLRNVKVSHGDYQANELGSALDPYLPQVAEQMDIECRGRKTVCFLPLVSTAEKMAEALNAAGLRAVAASGYDNAGDRARKKEMFERGDYDVLCNSMLYTEGWDCPAVDCVVVLRPTRSRALYSQMVGRGTRLAPGKDHLLLLDFLWMTEKHDLARPASLLGKDDAVKQKADEMLEEGFDGDLTELVDVAQRDVVAEREKKLAEELEKMRHRKKKLVDPLQFAMSIQDLDLAEYRPTFAWELTAPTDGQRRALENMGIDSDAVKSRGQASALIDSLTKRIDAGLATPKQVRLLEQRGFMHVGSWTKEAATKMISRISMNRWMVPRDINPATYDPREVTSDG